MKSYINQENDDLYVYYDSEDGGETINAIWYKCDFKKLTWWWRIKIWIKRKLGIDCWDIFIDR